MHVVIVGGGFAGVKAALELSKRHIGKVTLVSDETYFLHHATLYATATGRSTSESVIPLQDIFLGRSDVTVVNDTMTALDPERRLVIGGKKQYHYDALVIAIGSVTTYFGIKGMAQHAYGIKSLDEIRKFQAHIHQAVVNDRLDQDYFVIGAGPTGVELAGALNEYLHYLIRANHLKNSRARVNLVEAAPHILPRMSATAARRVKQRLRQVGIRVMDNQKVEALDDDTIVIDGKKIPTTTAVWTSGVANNPFFAAHDHLFHLADNGRVNVDAYLQALPNIYVVGDNNTVRYSGMAWPALKQATFVAKHLSRKAAKRPVRRFRPVSVPTGLPVGEGWGYVEWLGMYVSGRPGAAARRLMELYGYAQLVPFGKALSLWRAHDIAEFND